MVFCGFFVGHDCVFAAIGIARNIETVSTTISLAFSSTSAPVKGNVKPRSSQPSGWSCHAKERAGSNFYKVSPFNNWFMLNVFFASAAVNSELGVDNSVAVLKNFIFLYFQCDAIAVYVSFN